MSKHTKSWLMENIASSSKNLDLKTRVFMDQTVLNEWKDEDQFYLILVQIVWNEYIKFYSDNSTIVVY